MKSSLFFSVWEGGRREEGRGGREPTAVHLPCTRSHSNASMLAAVLVDRFLFGGEKRIEKKKRKNKSKSKSKRRSKRKSKRREKKEMESEREREEEGDRARESVPSFTTHHTHNITCTHTTNTTHNTTCTQTTHTPHTTPHTRQPTVILRVSSSREK